MKGNQCQCRRGVGDGSCVTNVELSRCVRFDGKFMVDGEGKREKFGDCGMHWLVI